jgi:hypothetical protein
VTYSNILGALKHIIYYARGVEKVEPQDKNYQERLNAFRKVFDDDANGYSSLTELPLTMQRTIWENCVKIKLKFVNPPFGVCSNSSTFTECFDIIKKQYELALARIIEREEDSKKPYWSRRWFW